MSQESSTSEPTETPAPSSAEATEGAAAQTATNGSADPQSTEMIGNFPPEIATLLIVAGIAGILLPGPIGTPLVLAGGVVLWPKTFRPIESWFSRRFPAFHHEGVVQLKEFLDDLNRRFPEENSEQNT